MARGFGKYESLHNHTVISDGTQTHLEVLETAEQSGFGLVSFTDHDILPRKKDMQELAEYDGLVDWNVGIEVSSNLPLELGARATTLFHILGLGIDPADKDLQEYCIEAETARYERFEQTIKNLQSGGFALSLDRCREIAGEGAPGSRHISRALLEGRENIDKLEMIANDMAYKAKDDRVIAENFTKMQQKIATGKGHPYVRELLLSDNAYIPGVYVPYNFGLDMDQTVRMVRNAGGVAVMAHWPTVKRELSPQYLEKIAEQKRIDGLELRSVYNVNPEEIRQDQAFLQSLARRCELLTTFGVDGHEVNDFAEFIRNIDDPNQTTGQWEALEEFIES